MTTFDASAMTGATNPTPPSDNADSGVLAETFDALAMLREQVNERNEEEDDLAPIEVPGIGWRLMCDITFTYAQYAEWQKAALPRKQRNGRKANPLDLNQTDLAFNVLLNTCHELQYRRNGSGDWEPLVDVNGAALLPASDALLRQFDVVDPRSFLRKLFGREARLVEASQRVAAKAGWLDDDVIDVDEDTDSPDPTD